jgi:hypothetical protein
MRLNWTKCLTQFFLFLIMGNAYSSELVDKSLDRYYNNLFLGEKRTLQYNGPLSPESTFLDETGDWLSHDDRFYSNYLNDQIQVDAFELHDFWFKKIKEKSACPDQTLGENIEYIRHLYRLLSISYLFESLKNTFELSSKLGDAKLCSLDFKEVFGNCRPKSDDMNKFYERVYGKFVNEISKQSVASFSKKEQQDWLDAFHRSNSLTLDLGFAQMHEWCFKQKKNCKNLSVLDVKQALKNICQSDRSLVQKVCNEDDGLYGISTHERATELVQASNAFNLINQNGMGEDCLRRFVKIFKSKEVQYPNINRYLPLIYSKLNRENRRYLQGELFLPGALKEFDMKGLSDFLAALKPPKIETKVVALPKPRPRPKPTPKPVEQPKPVTPAPKPEAVVVEIPETVAPKISEFERAVRELDEKKLSTLTINMDQFRDDFEFTPQILADLALPIKKFQTRAALTDMKSFDKLGDMEAPVGLVFLKYLIDTDNHQGLFNIQSVLGEKFFVYNDIENKDKPVFIELKNDSSTNNRWQIILLKPTPKKIAPKEL